MTTFDDREKAFERRYAHDQELEFRVNAKRVKLVGLWAAGKLELTGDKAESYAKSLVMSDFDAPGDDDVVQKLLGDFHAAGLKIVESDIRKEMARQLEVARELVSGEAKPAS